MNIPVQRYYEYWHIQLAGHVVPFSARLFIILICLKENSFQLKYISETSPTSDNQATFTNW